MEVTFPALTEALKDVTVEVKNSKNEVVAVLAQDLSKGATSAYFDFEKDVTAADLTGTWTVNGKEYNFTELKSVAEITDAAEKNQYVKLALDLAAADVKDADEDLIEAYAAAITAANKEKELTKVSEVQAIVDQINEDVSSVKSLVETIETGAQVKIYNALNANLKRVDSNLVSKYLAAKVELKDETTPKAVSALTVDDDLTNVDLEGLQSVVDRVNLEEAYALYTTASGSMTATNIAAVETAITKYDDGTEIYKFFKDQLQELKLVRALLDADKATTIKKALNNLVTYDADMAAKYKDAKDFDVVKADLSEVTLSIHPDIKKELFKDIAIVDDNVYSTDEGVTTYAKILKSTATSNASDVNSVKDVAGIVSSVNNTRATDLYTTVKSLDPTTKTAKDLLDALKAAGLQQVADTNKDVYFTPGTPNVNNFAGVTGTGAVTKADLQKQLDTLNIQAVEDATTTTGVLTALKVFGIDNIVDANAAEYIADFSSVTAGNTNELTVEAVKTKVADINKTKAEATEVAAINKAESVADVKTALDALYSTDSLTDYSAVRSVDRSFVAAYVLEKRPTDATKYADLAAVQAEVADAVTAYSSALNGVNAIEKTSTTAVVITALNAILDENFSKLGNAEKDAKAEAFQEGLTYNDANKIKTPFVSLAEIKAELNK